MFFNGNIRAKGSIFSLWKEAGNHAVPWVSTTRDAGEQGMGSVFEFAMGTSPLLINPWLKRHSAACYGIGDNHFTTVDVILALMLHA